ncbi:formate dehydrogenase subunit alpha [Flavobacterium gilvum]|uniref:Formate dehydrogenase subunit alpha n=1 Tax=Flavobacterium gilvum TaxID=1492737 RepID=A0AAC9I3Y0_9FLAO|nr:formate dehydrogenase subunit alpha [Flavobacterium gilvum]AOW09650.1 formate dehydrogenase subunit alpha [Flavobacterium gilvum]KFC58021.1 formate dehydrogenase subunit alpha [Flavobacterium gilvum]
MGQVAFINDKWHTIVEGETILEFVKRNHGKDRIPTLCDAPKLEPFGSCRVCSVEVALVKDGPTKTQASCHTPVIPNSYIYTDTDHIKKLRKNIIELVLTDHPMDCLQCEVNNNCELQSVAAKVGVRDVRYPQGKNHLDTPKDLSHPYMTSDFSKCINCFRCVRACDEIQGGLVLSMAGRGFDSHVVKSYENNFFESDCASCGACAQVCPTAAISDVFESKSINVDEKIRTVCSYCGVGCNLEVSVVSGKVKSIQAPINAEVNEGHLCLKGRYAFSFYDHQDRIKTPLIRRNGVLEPTTWKEAYDFITEKLTAIIQKNGPDAVAGVSSSRCTNEENYLMQKFMRAAIGTNNIDCCARVCHGPTAFGMQKAFGTGAATNSIEDIKLTDCIMVIGSNPTNAHPVTGAKIKQFAMKGKTTIVIDPRKTEIAKYATYHLQLRPGTNVALLNMILYYIITEGYVSKGFIKHRTEGYEEFSEKIKGIDIAEMEKITGVDRNLVREAALVFDKAPNAMLFHGLGVTEHSQGSHAVMLIADLAMITGNIGRRGVGVNPLRGQNNVQGAADMGCQPNMGAGYMSAYDPEINKHYEAFYERKIPTSYGYKIPEMFDAALDGKLKAMWIMGEDVVHTDPNTNKVIAALESLELLVVQELFLSETTKHATVVLPGASFLEKTGTFTNGERRIQQVNAVVEVLDGAKTDGQILVDMMNKMGYYQAPYQPKAVLREISKIVPFFSGVTWEGLGINGKQWPVKEDGLGTKILHTEKFEGGIRGKFNFYDFKETNEIVKNGKDFPYILTTNRGLEHYNSGTMTRRTDNVKILTEDHLKINPIDAEKFSIKDEDLVCVMSARGKVDMRASVSDEVKPGILSTTFHFPDVLLNLITGNEHDCEAMCPEYKVVAVNIRKSKGDNKKKLDKIALS